MAAGPVIELWSSEGWPQSSAVDPSPAGSARVLSLVRRRDSAEHVHARICAVNGEREEIHVERKRRIQGRGHAERSWWATLANVFAGG